MSNSKISNNKKLENYKKILKLYRCLGIENKDRDYIESIIKKIEELEKELPKKVSNDDLKSLRYIIATEELETPISSNGKFPDDLKKFLNSSDINKIRVEGIFLKEGAILEYNKIIEEKKNKSLDISDLFQQPKANITKRKYYESFSVFDGKGNDPTLVKPKQQRFEEKHKKSMITLLQKYPDADKVQLDPNEWSKDPFGQDELSKISYLGENDNMHMKLLLVLKGGPEEYNRLITEKSPGPQLQKKSPGPLCSIVPSTTATVPFTPGR